MPTLNSTQLNQLATDLAGDDVAAFYGHLVSYGDSYGDLALSVTNNSTWEAKLSNLFAANGAADNSVNLAYGSSAWLDLNKAIAQDYLDAYNLHSGASPSWSEIQTIHNNEYQLAGLDENDWLPNKMLNDSGDPASLWADLLVNQGEGDLFNDVGSAGLAGAALLFPPYFTAAALSDPNFVDQIDFARHFWDAFLQMDGGDRAEMATDVGNAVLTGVVDTVNGLPESVAHLLDGIAGIIDDPSVLIFKALPDWLENIIGMFGDTEAEQSPLVLDLDGNGIELSSLNAAGTVYWDIDSDGFREATAWIKDGDGLLAIDLNEDGAINAHTELFGNQSGSPNGFSSLAAYDTNHDGFITSSDTQFDDLLVWVDSNADGYSESAELHTLDSLNITSINLDYDEVNYSVSGNTIRQESSFTINGNTRDIVDAWFAYDNVNSIYGDDYTLDARTLFLPTLRGYGNLPDLHIAMSLNEDLLDMVQEVASATVADLLDPSFDAQGKVLAILYEWAGVSDIATDSRGSHLSDARMLEFLEEFMAKDYVQVGIWTNPGSHASELVQNTFQAAYDEFFARFIAQTELGTLLEGNHYDPISDTFDGFSDISSAVLSDIEDLADTSTDPSYLWQQVGRLIDHSVGFANLDVGDLAVLQDAALNSGTAISGNSSGNTLNGTSDNDAIFGFGGNDSLYGYAGHDTLIGGEGYDNLIGGTGNDTYVFAPNFGIATSSNPDFINENSGEGTDTIYLTGGITPEDIHFWTDSAGYFWLQVIADADDLLKGTAGTDANGTTVSSYIERIVFESGGTVWDLSQGLNLSDTDSGHTIKGAGEDDVIYGNGGNDTLYGYAGDDILVGGDGDKDTFYGGTGDDTYVFNIGFGNYTVSGQTESLTEETSEGNDTIYIRGALTPDDVHFWTDSNGYFFMQFTGDADDYLQGTAGVDAYGTTLTSRIENIIFETGTVWDLTEGLHLSASDSNNTIYGAGTADVIFGNGGNDTIHGYAGNDILYGNDGADSLYGEGGADTFTFEAATAFNNVDTIFDFNTGEDDAIDISDVLDGYYTPGVSTITDFIQITDNGINSFLKVDQDGTANGTNFVTVANIMGVTGLTDEAALASSGNLIVA